MSIETLVRDAYLRYADGKPWPIDRPTGLQTLPMPNGEMFQQIKGIPGWVASERFTIDAKADGPAITEMMRGPMMRPVLAERFKLKFHWETRDAPVYELGVAKGGPKLQSTAATSCQALDPVKGPPRPGKPGQAPPAICGGFRRSNNGGLDVYGVTLADLCVRLSMAMDRDVIDKTGIAGRFDLHLDVAFNDVLPRGLAETNRAPMDPAALPAASEPGGSVARAMSRIGLKLTQGKIPRRFLVIDHVERPTGN